MRIGVLLDFLVAEVIHLVQDVPHDYEVNEHLDRSKYLFFRSLQNAMHVKLAVLQDIPFAKDAGQISKHVFNKESDYNMIQLISMIRGFNLFPSEKVDDGTQHHNLHL